MSIASAITAAQGRVADAYTAISAKGGTLPVTQNLTNMPTAINSIPSGGGGGGTIITATNATGSAITAGDKVWITPNGNSYDIVNLTKLQANFEIVGSPTIDYETGVVSNMNNSNFIHVNKYLNSKNVEAYFKIYPTSLPADATILKSAERDYSALYIRASDGYVCWYDGSRGKFTSGSSSLFLNRWNWVYFKTSSDTSKITCWTLLDNGYTLDTLPEIAYYTGWQRQFEDTDYSGTGIGTNQYMFNIGNYEYGFFGSVDLKNTIIRNGPNNNTIIEPGVNYNGILWQPFEVVSNLGSTSFSGYATENIAINGTGQVLIADENGGGGEGSGTTDVTLSRFSDDNGNEIGTHFMNFVDANGNKFKVILLDAQYRNSSTQWCSSNVSITDLPLYTDLASSNVWGSKETATYNTQLILDYCSANNLTSSACSHCRSQSFTINGTTYYGQLPNMVELSYVARHYGEFDALDTTASSYPSTNFSFSHSIWSSNQRNANYAWNLYQNGDVTQTQKTQAYFYTCPVLEIPA